MAALLAAWGDAPAVLQTLRHFPTLWLVPVVALTLWNYSLRWLKWQFYLRTLNITGLSLQESILVFLSGFALSVTPGKTGELAKSYWLRELVGSQRAPLARTVPIVFAERLTDGIAMLGLATFGLLVFPAGVLALLTVGLGVLVLWFLLHVPTLPELCFRLLARLPVVGRIATAVEVSYHSARILLSGRKLVVAVLLGLCSWFGECVALFLIVVGLGAEPSLALLDQTTFALAAGSLLGSASLLPGGLGAAEGVVAGVLEGVAGQPRALAVAATLLIRACTLWFGVALGAASLIVLSRKLVRNRKPGALEAIEGP